MSIALGLSEARVRVRGDRPQVTERGVLWGLIEHLQPGEHELSDAFGSPLLTLRFAEAG